MIQYICNRGIYKSNYSKEQFLSFNATKKKVNYIYSQTFWYIVQYLKQRYLQKNISLNVIRKNRLIGRQIIFMLKPFDKCFNDGGGIGLKKSLTGIVETLV